jgi:hypothetical protein
VIIQFAFAIFPAVMLSVWLASCLMLSRGGMIGAKRSSNGLLLYGVSIIALGLLLDGANLVPRWLAGAEGYGVIIPIFSALVALLAGCLSFGVNWLLFLRHPHKYQQVKDS